MKRATAPFEMTRRYERYGFGDAAVPRRSIPARMLHPAIPGHFPTPKSPKGLVRTSSPLMMDALLHLDTDPLAIRVAEYPIQIEWWARDAYGDHYKRADIPDLGVVWRDGSLSFHSFTPLAIQAENPLFEADTTELDRVFSDEHDARYSVVDERDLHIRPLFPNLRTMWRHELGDLDPQAMDAVRVAIERRRRRNDAATIGGLRDDCALKPFWSVFEGGAAPRLLDGADRVFSALMTLAILGEVSLDTRRPFGDATAVTQGVLGNSSSWRAT